MPFKIQNEDYLLQMERTRPQLQLDQDEIKTCNRVNTSMSYVLE